MVTTLAGGLDGLRHRDAARWAGARAHRVSPLGQLSLGDRKLARAARIEDPIEEAGAALTALVDKIAPARSSACRPPNDKLAATGVIAVPITEASAKIRTGPLPDAGDDTHLPYWSGIIPIVTRAERPFRPERLQLLLDQTIVVVHWPMWFDVVRS